MKPAKMNCRSTRFDQLSISFKFDQLPPSLGLDFLKRGTSVFKNTFFPFSADCHWFEKIDRENIFLDFDFVKDSLFHSIRKNLFGPILVKLGFGDSTKLLRFINKKYQTKQLPNRRSITQCLSPACLVSKIKNHQTWPPPQIKGSPPKYQTGGLR